MWPAKIALARLRPLDWRLALRLAVVTVIFLFFLVGDFALFRRVFRAAAKIEALTPFFALGLIENFLGLVFLIALFVLFFSSMTSAIGAFFTDSDLEIYHAAPRRREAILLSRWGKTYVQASYLIIAFLLPMFLALFEQYRAGFAPLIICFVDLVLLVSIPISLASLVILLLVRYFPVARVHQIAATLGIIVLTLVIVGIRMARPERLFAEINTDQLAAVLTAIQLPDADLYPSGWLARAVADRALGPGSMAPDPRLAATATVLLLLFVVVGRRIYYPGFVRSRESSAPSALGSSGITRVFDATTRSLDPHSRAMFAKEVRVVTRDATQWSQLFMMIALLFIYLYNIRMMPLEGDARAPILAYLNLGMAGFVVSAICLRFAYPSLSAEGRAFWMLECAPISLRRLLWIKFTVYLLPLLLVSLLLTVLANAMLAAPFEIWLYTIPGTFFVTTTLVALGVGMGALAPRFESENPVEVALSLGGLAYMAISLLYVGAMMIFFARPMQRFFLRIVFGIHDPGAWFSRSLPTLAAIGMSLALIVVPIEVAAWRLAERRR